MEYTKLGTSDLTVSRLCLGCMSLGDASKGMHTWAVPYEESKEIIGYAYENGINFFDTAMGYQEGTGEQFLGRAIKELGIRDKVVLATKYMPRSAEELLQKYSGVEWIEKCLDDSLARLETDHIDLYIMHAWDYKTPVLDTLETLTRVQKAGKIRAFGISNCYAWLLTKATSPVVGATKKPQIDALVKAVDFKLSEEEIKYLEEPYVPHKLVGVIAMNPVEPQAK